MKSYKKVLMGKRRLRFMVVGCLAAPLLISCHWFKTPEEKAEKVVDYMSYKLELKDGQKQQLTKISDRIMAMRSQFRQDKLQDFDKLIAQVQKGQMNKRELVALYEKRRSTLDEEIPLLIEDLISWHKDLDETQKQKISKFLKKKRKKFED